jgi:hypothetical protein
MANRLKGEIAVELGEGGDKHTVIFRLGVNEMIGLQEALGLKENDEGFFAAIEKPRGVATLRTIVKWALVYGNPNITDEEAGEIITELTVPKIRKLIDDAVSWALPDKADLPPGATRGKGAAASPGPLPS